MSSHTQPSRELIELAAAVRDETLTTDQRQRLQDLLRGDQDARDYFLRFMSLHALLENRLTADVPDHEDGDATGRADAVPAKRASRWTLRFYQTLFMVAASLIVAVVGYFGYRQYRPAVEQPIAVAVATITDLDDAVWVPTDKGHDLGEAVYPGWIHLESGLIRLTYAHGVVVTIQGPADYEVRSRDEAILNRGRLAAYVPEGAEGFRVSTPNAKVVDLGTEFGVTVNGHGETELSVFDGRVELTPSVPQSETQVVESGLSYRVDTEGKTHQELIGLAPYRDARDSLRRWRIVWEPFGPGSGQPFPGHAGRGWLDAWSIDVQGGALLDERTGIFDEPKLFPGTEVHLALAAVAAGDAESCRLKVARSYGSIDQFTTTEPHTIELLVRLDCAPADIDRIRVFGTPYSPEKMPPPAWQFEANHSSSETERLAWQLAYREDGEVRYRTLPVRRGMTFRCFVEVHPQLGLWRTTVSNRRVSISNELRDGLRLEGDAVGPMALGVEVEGREGSDVRFSLDAIRIQNRPGVSTTRRADAK